VSDRPVHDAECDIDALLTATGMQLPDREHALRCADFAANLFAALHERLGLAASDRRLAIFGAMLHDIGFQRSGHDHHRKAFELLRKATLPGLSEGDRLIVACLARYHRGPLPNIEHAGFGEMVAEDQRRTRRLSAIVRLAAALDASQLGFISEISVTLAGDSIRVDAVASREPAVERDRVREAEAAFLSLTYVPLHVEMSVEDYRAL
jgi:exopolyphosphatase/guanosine-5'-triphosphate,3'-diphosphate pyrophosphatase